MKTSGNKAATSLSLGGAGKESNKTPPVLTLLIIFIIRFLQMFLINYIC